MDQQTKIIQAIRDLDSSQKQQLNRLLACEAMLVAIVRRLEPQALAGVLEEYEAAIDRAAALLEPRLQMPEVWQQMSDVIKRFIVLSNSMRQSHGSTCKPTRRRQKTKWEACKFQSICSRICNLSNSPFGLIRTNCGLSARIAKTEWDPKQLQPFSRLFSIVCFVKASVHR